MRRGGAAPGSDGRRPVIRVRGLRKSYGRVEAVRGIDLDVHAGEVVAFVGPNGAGKTTTIEILEGYLRRDAGEVQVLGVDPSKPTLAWRARIGLVLQTCRLTAELTVRETLDRFAGYYPNPRAVDETLGLIGLTNKADARASTLSGGQQRRLDVGLALIGDPELIFLDEPTTGFDPAARHEAWLVITGLRDLGKTIVLTTHDMAEAEALADRMAIIAGGRIVAEGPPETLGGRDRAAAQIRFRLPLGIAPRMLPVEGVEEDGYLVVHAADVVTTLGTLLDWVRDRSLELPELTVTRPSLEDTYLTLIGRTR